MYRYVRCSSNLPLEGNDDFLHGFCSTCTKKVPEIFYFGCKTRVTSKKTQSQLYVEVLLGFIS